MRAFTHYAKVQAAIGMLRRNRHFQLSSTACRTRNYLDVGCGPKLHAQFVNLDYLWRPGIDVCWDVTRGLPFRDGRFQGIFSEHCLEHFPPELGLALLREMRRVLAPGGHIRLVVPDAEQYLRAYLSHLAQDGLQRFPYESAERSQPGWRPLTSVNRVFYQDRSSPFGHRVMFDYDLLAHWLADAGFVQISKSLFNHGRDPSLVIDSPERACESLYVEATAP